MLVLRLFGGVVDVDDDDNDEEDDECGAGGKSLGSTSNDVGVVARDSRFLLRDCKIMRFSLWNECNFC